jgi:succinate dehydrogenase / fumarate reductase iron-sulfur subunit
VTIAPLTKFPLIKDLVVNRDLMFEQLKRIKAWVEVDDALDRGFGPKVSQKVQEAMYLLSTCMTCGCCSEACPQVNAHSKFMGPAPISQARLFNAHPVGKLMESERLKPLMEEGGVSECGNAQNCAAVCPKKIPLTESIALMGRRVAKEAVKQMVSLPDA